MHELGLQPRRIKCQSFPQWSSQELEDPPPNPDFPVTNEWGISQVKNRRKLSQIWQVSLGPDEEGWKSHKSHIGVRRPVRAHPVQD
jgi:hypothetical protein